MKNLLIGLALLLAGCNGNVSEESLSYVGAPLEERVYFESLEEMLVNFEGGMYLPQMDEGYFLGSIYKTGFSGLDGEVVAADFNFKNEGEAFTYTVVLAKDYDLEDVEGLEEDLREYYFEKDDYVYFVYAATGVSRDSLIRVADSVQL